MSDLHGGPWWTHFLKDISGGKSMEAGVKIAVAFIIVGTLAVKHGITKLAKTLNTEPAKK